MPDISLPEKHVSNSLSVCAPSKNGSDSVFINGNNGTPASPSYTVSFIIGGDLHPREDWFNKLSNA